MLLAIDIGNSNIVWGLFQGQKLTGPWRLATDPEKTSAEYGTFFTDRLHEAHIPLEQVTDVILCSVVPTLTPVLAHMAESCFHTKPLVVSSGMETGLTLRYTNPQELGTDRLVNASAAYDRYKTALIVVDMGTATTFCAITGTGEYLGGVIAPGLGIAAEALAAKTAQLPAVDLVPPATIIGRDTKTSIQSGLLYGHAGLVDELVTRIQKELGQQAKVIATGGFSALIAPLSRTIQEVRANLTLEGLELLHRRAKTMAPNQIAASCHSSPPSLTPKG